MDVEKRVRGREARQSGEEQLVAGLVQKWESG